MTAGQIRCQMIRDWIMRGTHHEKSLFQGNGICASIRSSNPLSESGIHSSWFRLISGKRRRRNLFGSGFLRQGKCIPRCKVGFTSACPSNVEHSLWTQSASTWSFCMPCDCQVGRVVAEKLLLNSPNWLLYQTLQLHKESLQMAPKDTKRCIPQTLLAAMYGGDQVGQYLNDSCWVAAVTLWESRHKSPYFMTIPYRSDPNVSRQPHKE